MEKVSRRLCLYWMGARGNGYKWKGNVLTTIAPQGTYIRLNSSTTLPSESTVTAVASGAKKNYIVNSNVGKRIVHFVDNWSHWSQLMKGMINTHLDEIIQAKKNEKLDEKEANRLLYLLMNLPTDVFSGNRRFKQLILEFLRVEYATPVNLSLMIPGCAKHGMMKEMLQLFDQVYSNPTTSTVINEIHITMLMSELRRQNMADDAVKLYERVRTNTTSFPGLAESVIVNTSLLRACSRVSKPTVETLYYALDVFNQFLQSGKKPIYRQYGALIVLAAKVGNPEDVIKKLQTESVSKGLPTSSLTITTLMKAASISGDYKEILSLYEYLKKSKLAVDTTHITHVIEAYAKLGQIDQGLEVFIHWMSNPEAQNYEVIEKVIPLLKYQIVDSHKSTVSGDGSKVAPLRVVSNSNEALDSKVASIIFEKLLVSKKHDRVLGAGYNFLPLHILRSLAYYIVAMGKLDQVLHRGHELRTFNMTLFLPLLPEIINILASKQRWRNIVSLSARLETTVAAAPQALQGSIYESIIIGLIECQQIPYAMSLLNRYLQVIEFNEGNKGKVSVFSKNLVSNIMGKIDSAVRDSVKKEVTDTFNKLQYQHVNDVIANL